MDYFSSQFLGKAQCCPSKGELYGMQTGMRILKWKVSVGFNELGFFSHAKYDLW